jgi:uncharacterized protein YfaS (alpha-2-macroglobulin family)
VFDVSGEAETDWNYLNQYVIDLVADKDSYEPGQTATLMVKTPLPATRSSLWSAIA